MKTLRFTDIVASGLANGRRVFVRADLNVPMDAAGRITEDTRIRASLRGIEMALQAGAAVMVTSHLGRPTEGAPRPEDSLAPVAARLSELLDRNVPLVENWTSGVSCRPGEVVLLENCRVNMGETNDDEGLARRMAGLCDIYVNDAFGTAHRAEASTHGIARFAPLACAGPLLAAEIEAITNALAMPRRPLVAVVGGSKVSTKLTILKSLAEKVDHLIVGGGIANTFLLAAGHSVGKSLAEPQLVAQAQDIMALMKARGADVPLPTDVIVASSLSAANGRLKNVADVGADEMILDIGPRTAQRWAAQLDSAGTIVWNGPVGMFEAAPFSRGTEAVARAIASSRAFSLAGGGDTLAAIAKWGIEREIDYISTGGGAFLEMLEGKQLPAVRVLQERATP